ncbi:MAG: BamA/OMP85 family outer membrane protein [Candidatus Zipacnadales bacterium]
MIESRKAMQAISALSAGLLLLLSAHAAWSQANVIADIRIEGAVYISPDAVLDTVNKTLKVGDALDPDSPEGQRALEDARRAVMGLNFFETVRTSVQRGDEGITITFSVVEKQRVKRITFVGNTIFNDEQLRDEIATREGQIINSGTLRRDAQKIADFYAANGRMANAVPNVDDFGVVNFVISEAIVEDIVIEGLKHTKPYLVRDRIKTKPGDVYDEAAIRRDVLTIANLGWFEEPDVQFRQGVKDPERGIIVVIVLKEKRTGTATAGIGYSSIDNVVGIISASEQNFRGRGERISGTIQFGGRESYEVGFYKPFVDKKGSSFEVNIFDTERRRQFLPGGSYSTANREFDERRKGFNLTVTRPMTERLQLSLRVRQEQISDPYFQVARVLPSSGGYAGTGINLPGYTRYRRGRYREAPPAPSNPNLDPDEPEPGDTLLPLVVYAPLADEELSSGTVSAFLDTRDLIHNPSRGHFASFSVEQAGIFGGDSDFTKLSIDLRKYLKMPRGKHVLAMRLLGGTTLGDVPLVESYSIGGAYSLRGYTEDRFRGEKMLLFSAEYRVPMSKNLTGVGFIDIGDAWDGEFSTSIPGFVIPAEHQRFDANIGVGVGARLNVGPFGMMRLDLGRGDEGTEVHLSFGHTF